VSLLSITIEQLGGEHFSGNKTAIKVLHCGLYWPIVLKGAHLYCKSYPKCQQFGKISRRDMMPLSPIIIFKIFYVWGIDFIGPSPSSFRNEYILLIVDYVSKWVEVVLTRKIEAIFVVKFLKENIFSRYACPRLSLVTRVLILKSFF